jgi:hypothetical protein
MVKRAATNVPKGVTADQMRSVVLKCERLGSVVDGRAICHCLQPFGARVIGFGHPRAVRTGPHHPL